MDITKDYGRNVYSIPDQVVTESGIVYDVQEYLGAGGNAAVHLALDFEGNEYAIKFNLNFNAECRSRFNQEIKVLKEIKHPNLLRCFDSGTVIGKKRGEEYDIPFMIMEKADYSLGKFLKKKGPLDYSEYIAQFCGLSEALAYLNERVVHRDIKLENILIVGEKWVLSDLGLCSFLADEEHMDLTRYGEKIGPKYWMSPESINRIYDESIEIIPASDVFQLSAVFWFVATGKYPLGIITREEWNNSDELTCDLLLKGLSFNSNNRPQNGKELFNAFQNVRSYYETEKQDE